MHARPSPSATVALAILAGFTVWITWRAKAIESGLSGHIGRITALDGKPAPDFQLASLDGRTVSVAEFRGKKKLVVSFWASWCGPCRRELPVLARFYQQTHDAADYEIVAISVDNNRADAQAGATQLKLPFPVLLDLTGATSQVYGVDAIPALFVIGKDGKVLNGQAGFEMGFELLLAQQLGIKNYNPAAGATHDGGH